MKEINNTTIYDKETIRKFLQIHYFERIKTLRIILNIFIAIIIISFIINKNRSVLDIITFIFALFGIIELNTSLLPSLNYYKLKKKKDSIINTKVTYTFKKNNFKLNKNEYIDYNTLKKVIETNDSYYLYINNTRSLIVTKSTLKEDEISMLTNNLKKHVSIYKNK